MAPPNATNSSKNTRNKAPQSKSNAQVTIDFEKLIDFPVLAFSSKLINPVMVRCIHHPSLAAKSREVVFSECGIRGLTEFLRYIDFWWLTYELSSIYNVAKDRFKATLWNLLNVGINQPTFIGGHAIVIFYLIVGVILLFRGGLAKVRFNLVGLTLVWIVLRIGVYLRGPGNLYQQTSPSGKLAWVGLTVVGVIAMALLCTVFNADD